MRAWAAVAAFAAAGAMARRGHGLDGAATPVEVVWSAEGIARLTRERTAEEANAAAAAAGSVDHAWYTSRHLQATTCTPTIANGVWAGSPPNLAALCVNTNYLSYPNYGYQYGSTTWTFTCNSG